VRAPSFAALALVAGLAAGCWQLKSNRCDQDSDCGGAGTCNLTTRVCLSHDAGPDVPMRRDSGSDERMDAATDRPVSCTQSSCIDKMKPICASPHDGALAICGACTEKEQCVALANGNPACNMMTGECVACVDSSTCSGTTPVCNTTTNACAKCAVDSDCSTAPGVCMRDGHCAMSSEVIFVQYSASGCPNPNGTAAKPYCNLSDATTRLTASPNGPTAVVVLGAANDQLTLGTTGIQPLIVGRPVSGTPGSISAVAGTAITISSDDVQIRDLTVNAGSQKTSKGVLATGNGTKLTLTRVMVSLTTGLGIDAESGVTLAMDHSTVSANSAGGILLNGAAFDIENTTVTGNGPGLTGSTSWGGIFVESLPTAGQTLLNLDSIQSNNQVGVACAQPITGMGVLASNNAGQVDVQPSCGSGVAVCTTASTSCGAQP
jgi:hypothetical protein